MPIEVRHDIEGGPLAAAAFAAGAGARAERDADRDRQVVQFAQQLQQQRDLQQMDIEARANLQKQAADQAYARTALQHGLDEQIREEDFDRRMQQMQEASRIQAQQWEYQYTGKQRQEIARFNTAKQAIQSSAQFSPEEKAVAMQLMDLQQANIKPSMMPRDPSKPIYPEGRGLGDMWQDDQGNTVGLDREGNPKLILRYDQSPKFHEARLQAEREKADMALQAKREQQILTLRMKLATEEVPGGKDKSGNEVYRHRTTAEVDSVMQSVLGGQTEQQQAPQRQWWENLEASGIAVTENDMRLPSDVGSAQAFMRQMNRQYGGLANVPPDKREAYMDAAKILGKHAGVIQ